jgi:hypothetical protein
MMKKSRQAPTEKILIRSLSKRILHPWAIVCGVLTSPGESFLVTLTRILAPSAVSTSTYNSGASSGSSSKPSCVQNNGHQDHEWSRPKQSVDGRRHASNAT